MVNKEKSVIRTTRSSSDMKLVMKYCVCILECTRNCRFPTGNVRFHPHILPSLYIRIICNMDIYNPTLNLEYTRDS